MRSRERSAPCLSAPPMLCRADRSAVQPPLDRDVCAAGASKGGRLLKFLVAAGETALQVTAVPALLPAGQGGGTVSVRAGRRR